MKEAVNKWQVSERMDEKDSRKTGMEFLECQRPADWEEMVVRALYPEILRVDREFERR